MITIFEPSKATTMELLVVDSNSESMRVSLGISEDRFRELMELCHRLPKTRTLSSRAQLIAGFCNTLMEYTLCMVQDIKWLITTGVIEIELTDEAKARYGLL